VVETAVRLLGLNELSSSGNSLRKLRVLDAGSGWGGTSFALAGAITGASNSPMVAVDGLTLSPVQASMANAASAERGLSELVRFHVR
jgi:cyclopropane fatty-acyl-phospholipid synthase-like methyltransferase